MKKEKIILVIIAILSIVVLLRNKNSILKNNEIKTENISVTKISQFAQGSDYKDATLNGADPVLSDKLIPVTIDKNGKVTYADIKKEWYNYQKKEWANAVILVDNPSLNYEVGTEIKESDIESYFVWIPRFRYKLWNANQADGAYEKSKITDDADKTTSFRMMFGNARLIEIEFENNKAGKSSGSTNGNWLTHPAFTLNNKELNGIWVGKFETGYNQGTPGEPITDTSTWNTTRAEQNKEDSERVIVKPNVYSWRNINVSNMFKTAYNYERDLDSHMMRNTEWGAVAYLSHSLYGIGKEVNINNNSDYKTGYSALIELDQSANNISLRTGNTNDRTLPYNTLTGYLASTTGNITGVYDISGGSEEYVAAYVDKSVTCNSNGNCSGFTAEELTKYNAYFDKYSSDSNISSYSKRILGDATGEMGPFYHYFSANSQVKSLYNSWYADSAAFVETNYPWFQRGDYYGAGISAGLFKFARNTGNVSEGMGYRIVFSIY